MTEATEASDRGLAADTSPPHLRRARIACKACNARRVKCDAADGQPCWHCRTRRTPCELIESKRGKYVKPTLPQALRTGTEKALADAPAGQSAQPLLLAGASSETVRDADAPQHCDGSNADKLLGQLQQIQGFDTLSAGTDQLQPVTERQNDQSRQTARSHGTTKAHRVSYIVEVVYKADNGVTESLKVHYSIPASIVEPPVSDRGRRVGKFVSLAEALIMPVGEVADELIRAFFEVIHPAYPVFDRKEFMRRYLCGDSSPLVLQTIYLLGFTHIELGEKPTGKISAEANLVVHLPAAFGQPCRIRDEDCDVEPLTEQDFTFDDDYDQGLIPAQQDFHISYVIEMSKLAMILGDILTKEFSPRRPEPGRSDTEALVGRLSQWESRLPHELRKEPLSGSLDASFWASMLHFSYQSIEVLSSAEAERDVRVRSAADSITRMAEDLLGNGTIKFAQIHLVPSLFGALSVHTIAICRRDHVRQQLAENKARQCLLALSELAKSWPVKIWIAEAFVDLMERLTGQVSSGGSIVSVSTKTASTCSNHLTQRATTPQAASAGNTTGASVVLEELDQPDLHTSGVLPQTAGTAFSDPFWDGYADNNTFDIDFLLHTSLEPVLSAPFSGQDGTEGGNTLGL
ncbi:Acetamidase regulatory protein [Lasiodiplodia hormozganensis]|uniref:Acetamidase regulatory protein n=1 Tax=Lasiodiplodia hormozganensis TaxID=869390 RepID=A0AA39XUL5_9PEZI|nr:Acetamidase regulatory protein [Lasiodiplodia hormozganensis]